MEGTRRGVSIDLVGDGMSVPSEMPFSVEFGNEDVSRLQLVMLGRDLDGPICHRITDLRIKPTKKVRTAWRLSRFLLPRGPMPESAAGPPFFIGM